MKKQFAQFNVGNVLSLLTILGAIYGSYFKLHEAIAVTQRDVAHLTERVAKLESAEIDLKRFELDEATAIANQKILLERVTNQKQQETK